MITLIQTIVWTLLGLTVIRYLMWLRQRRDDRIDAEEFDRQDDSQAAVV